VRELILATCHDARPESPPAQLLCDVDLAVLGADADRYAEFELQVRAEHWWMPTALYRKHRAEILTSYARRPSIFATHEFRERFEHQARNNIVWGLEQLSIGSATFRWTARF